MTTAAAVTRVAGRDKVLGRTVMPVMVKVINAKRIRVPGVDAVPSHWLPAPVARMRPGANGVVQDNPVHVCTPIGHGDRVTRVFADTVALGVQGRPWRLIYGTGPGEPLAVQLTEAVSVMRPVAALNLASVLVPPPVDIAVVLQAPVVHLAQSLALIRLSASLNGTDRVSGRSLKCAERVTVSKKTNCVSLAVAMGIMARFAAFDRAHSHNPIIAAHRAREPGFYGATYCCTCRRHLPVGKHGEFTWIEADGPEAGNRVGT